jgi:tetratricopeptide (TPR) repeat protein
MNQDQYSELQTLLGLRNYEGALQYLAALERTDPEDPTFAYHRGVVLRASGDLDGAASEYYRALSLDAEFARARQGLGIVRQLQGKFGPAIQEFKTALELDPTLASGWNSLGLTHKKAGQLHDALAAYHRAQEVIVNRASDTIGDRPGGFSEGLGPDGERVFQIGPEYMPLVQRELKSDNMYSTVMNNIGQCYADAGEIGQARSAFQEAIDFIPDGSDYRAPIANLAALGEAATPEDSREKALDGADMKSFLDDVSGLISAWGHEVSRTDEEIRITYEELETVVRWVHEDAVTSDGARIIGRILVLSVLPHGWLPERSPELLPVLNMATALGAVTQDAVDGAGQIGSRFTLYEGDEDGWRVGAMLLAMSALTQLHVVSHTMVRLSGGDPGGYHPVSQAPAPEGLEEAFTTTTRLLTDAGFYANASRDGLTVEFPWDSGAYSAAAQVVGLGEGRTALLTMSVSEAHPALGPGLLVRLTLPLRVEAEAAYEMVDELNRLELAEKDAPPLFGAWCSPPDSGDVVFVSFVPLALVRLQMTSAAAFWMAARTQQVLEWLH